MDLVDFDEFLPVISGSKKGIQLCEKIRSFLGTDDPEQWLPLFTRGIHQLKDVMQAVNSEEPEIWFPALMEKLQEKQS
jgi:type IV secretion system protein VirB4